MIVLIVYYIMQMKRAGEKENLPHGGLERQLVHDKSNSLYFLLLGFDLGGRKDCHVVQKMQMVTRC